MEMLVWNTALDEEGNALSGSLKGKDIAVTLSRTTKGGESLNHLLLVDEDAYRLEAPHKFVKAADFTDFYPEIAARICFNDCVMGPKIAAYFESLKRHCLISAGNLVAPR